MLPDLSSKAQHCKMYCARLVGLVNGGGRAEEGVGGWYGHDTERGHGGCDGNWVEARSTARHPQWLVGWSVVETREKKGKALMIDRGHDGAAWSNANSECWGGAK